MKPLLQTRAAATSLGARLRERFHSVEEVSITREQALAITIAVLADECMDSLILERLLESAGAKFSRANNQISVDPF